MKQHIVMNGIYLCEMAGGSLPSQSPQYDSAMFNYENGEQFEDYCINCGKKLKFQQFISPNNPKGNEHVYD